MHNLMSWSNSTGYGKDKTVPLTIRSTSDKMFDDMQTATPIQLPNLVAGYKCDTTGLSTISRHKQYTPNEWYQKQEEQCSLADSCRHASERIRHYAIQTINEAEEKVRLLRYDTDRKLYDRISDINFWRNEIASELERLQQEAERVQNCHSTLEKMLHDIEGPLHIAQECLYYRIARKDTELVLDGLEKCLRKEIKILNENRNTLEIYLSKCKKQLQDCRVSQCRLELDLKNKDSALGTDVACYRLSNYSHGLEYHEGVEIQHSCHSEPDSWIDAANRIIEKSQMERKRSCQLRTASESLVRRIAREIWNAWNDTNNALARRNLELSEAKKQLQLHLHKVLQEACSVNRNLALVRKAIADKGNVLKLAQTRLKTRTHRPDIELCRDYAHTSLQNEISEINHQMERLYQVLMELEHQQQKLLTTQTVLERDLELKMDAMHIDGEKVPGLRRAFPIQFLVKYLT